MTAGALYDRDVRFGDGAIDLLPSIVQQSGADRVLLVTGRSSFQASGASRVLGALEAVTEVTRWADFQPNTDAADLHRGLVVAADAVPDLIIAVGGGSAMDMAKLLCAYDGIEGEAALHDAIRSGDRIGQRRQGLVLVPTTSGSGSEATHFAVVYVGEDKYSVAGPALLPDITVLDPQLTRSGSPYQRATSGIDAVAQAIESLWAVAGTDESRAFARAALPMLVAHLEEFVHRPGAESARAMALGSHLAGRAIDTSRTTAAHALSYGFTKGHGVSHGHAVALTLGVFIAAHAAAPNEALRPEVPVAEHHRAMMAVLGALDAEDGTAGRRRLEELMTAVGLGGLPDVMAGGDGAELSRLAATVNNERLGNNPVVLDDDALSTVLLAALRDQPVRWEGRSLVLA